MSSFSIGDVFSGVSPPIYLRKVARPGHWDPTSPETILENVFPEDDGIISIWKAETDIDLQRIAFALNANRIANNPEGGSLTQKMDFLPIEEQYLVSSPDIKLTRTDGETKCLHARALHYDAHFTEAALPSLVGTLLNVGTKTGRLSPGKLKSALATLKTHGCRAVVPESTGCECEDE